MVTKAKSYMKSFQNLQEKMLKQPVENYKKGVDLAPLVEKIRDVDLTSKELGLPTVHGSKGALDIAKKINDIQFKKTWTG